MAVSLNSLLGFNSSLHVKHQHARRSSIPAKTTQSTFPFRSSFGSRGRVEDKRSFLCLSIADTNPVTTDADNEKSGNAPPIIVPDISTESGPKTSEFSNGSAIPSDLKLQKSTPPNSTRKAPLTARERLRAARVLNRYTEPKPSKSEMGSKVLEALKESDKGKKKSRLPEAPTNIFDDSKRGMPKKGLTFDFPGGSDLLIIAFSFVFISTVMFATTYIVWKVGAIHFNEY